MDTTGPEDTKSISLSIFSFRPYLLCSDLLRDVEISNKLRQYQVLN